jgi:hypothetical protein
LHPLCREGAALGAIDLPRAHELVELRPNVNLALSQLLKPGREPRIARTGSSARVALSEPPISGNMLGSQAPIRHAYVPIWAGCRWKDVSAARGLRKVLEAIRRHLPSPAQARISSNMGEPDPWLR